LDIKTSEEFYEKKYQNEKEPWGYSEIAVEVLRHEFIVKTANEIKPKYKRILDVGCGKGQLTFLFNGLANEIVGVDVSQTAVNQASASAEKFTNDTNETKYEFAVDNILTPNFPENYFDLILLCDGIEEWFKDEREKTQALQNVHKLLMPGGYAILSDYQKPQHFASFVNFISQSPLIVVKSLCLNDRLCYQFNSWFKMFEKAEFVKWIYANKNFAKVLMRISSLFGVNGSKHFCVVAQKK
jgi:SAM-dependent methyltransferase